MATRACPDGALDPWRRRADDRRDTVVLEVGGTRVTAERLTERMLLWQLDVSELLERAFGLDYAERCHEVAKQCGRPCLLDGQSSTSCSRAFGDHEAHTVVLTPGTDVQQHLPWLMSLYRGEFLALANLLVSPETGGSYVTSPDPVSAVNLNLIPTGETYEWHVDSNPLTGLLFCPVGVEPAKLDFSSRPGAGREPWFLPVPTRWARLLLFDARDTPHCVRNVTAERVTVPMNFEIAGRDCARPPDLDRYLYG